MKYPCIIQDKILKKCTNIIFLSEDIQKWIYSAFKHYLDWNKVYQYNMKINSVWVNEMKAHEYNPVHIHQGKLYSGLSSVMILKLPKETGVEYSAPEKCNDTSS